MGQYTSYYLYQKYETRGSQEAIPVYPNVYSIDADGTRERVVKIQDDTQCGYDPPVKPIYKWVNIPITQDYVCDDCPEYQTRWVKTDETTCVKEGPDPQYRWVNMDASVDYYCEGTTKYYKQKKQVSYDGGQTWQDVSPAEYQKGGVAEEQSADCGYVNWDYKIFSIKDDYGNDSALKKCGVDGNDLHPFEITGTSSSPSTIFSSGRTLFVGSCVNTIASSAFTDISVARDFVIGDLTPTSNTTVIQKRAFFNNTLASGITIGNNVTSLGVEVFRGCSGLINLYLSDKIKDITSGACDNCANLKLVNIPSGVTSIGGCAFYQCSGLTSFNIPDSVTSIGEYAFYRCSGLTSVIIGNSTTSIGRDAFGSCRKLTSIVIPSSVTSIGQEAFVGCSGVTSITIGSGVTSIDYGAFQSCSGLTSIICLATTPPTLGRRAFYGTNNCPIYVPAESVNAYQSATNWSTYASRIQPISQVMPKYKIISGNPYCDEDNKVVDVYQQISYDNGSTWETINTVKTLVERKCVDCGAPQLFTKYKFTYSNGDTAIGKVYDIDGRYLGLTSTETHPIGYTFGEMVSAEIFQIYNIKERAFKDCLKLKTIKLNDEVKYISRYAFLDCRSLTSIVIPSSVTSIGQQAFSYCSGLTSITIEATTPPSISSNDVFGTGNNCPIYVPCQSVDLYKSTTNWSSYADRIQPIP